METVNAMASAAAKAVWGDSTAANEPVSGKTGNTSAGEPYDAGNMDDTNTATTNTTTNTAGSTNAKSTGTGSTSEEVVPTGDAAFAKNTGNATTSSDTPENPSTQQKLKDTKSSAGQQDIRDPEDPNTHPKDAPTEVNTKDHQEDGANEDIKLDGPGPRPLNEVAREHGGDAGKVNERKGSLVPPRDPNDPNPAPKDDSNKDEDKGDGTQYVRSSGLNADGGDFDATKPGAGREADRLMEEKGMHVGGDNHGKPQDAPEATKTKSAGSDDSETKEKKKLSQRIKEKLSSH